MTIIRVNFDPADTAKVQREMYSALKARREALEDILRKRTEELKLLCIKEGELTGNLPVETPLGAGEEPPQIRRRIGTAFSLSADIPSHGEDDEIKKLEMEVDLQKQITNAAHKLASDKSVSRFVRKQRRHSFMKAQSKLKEMEKRLSELRRGGALPASPLSTGKYDGMYSVENGDQGYSFCDDTYVNRLRKFRPNQGSMAHRLSRSFRERNLLKYHKLIDTRVKTERNSSMVMDSSLDESGVACDSRLDDDSRLADQTRSSLNSSGSSDAESYKISNDSLYHSSYKYIPEETLDSAFLTPPPVLKRNQKTVMSPTTRRSKRASWHHTMFQKSPLPPRANKETAV